MERPSAPVPLLAFQSTPRKAAGEVSLPGSPAPGDVLSIPAARTASPGTRPEIRHWCSRPFPISDVSKCCQGQARLPSALPFYHLPKSCISFIFTCPNCLSVNAAEFKVLWSA